MLGIILFFDFGLIKELSKHLTQSYLLNLLSLELGYIFIDKTQQFYRGLKHFQRQFRSIIFVGQMCHRANENVKQTWNRFVEDLKCFLLNQNFSDQSYTKGRMHTLTSFQRIYGFIDYLLLD